MDRGRRNTESIRNGAIDGTDRTTTGNQYRFFLNHIGLFTNCFIIDYTKKEVVLSKSTAIDELLAETQEIIENPEFTFGQRL